jgi:sugar phosphate isomerase/epimerase
MLQEMAGFGFEYAELSHGIRITLVPGILQALEDRVIKIASTHNFCPLPAGVLQAAPNLFEPSSREPREHYQWVRHTKRSLDFAAQVKAKILVCHLGSVIFFWFNPGAKIRKYVESHEGFVPAEDPKYQALLAKSMKKLRDRSPPFWAQTQASVKEMLDYAAQKGVQLALENREKFEELPLDADFPAFLASLPPNAAAGYWHDTGHAHIKEQEGLLRHEEQLEKNASRLIGFHVHDVSADGRDHQAVGSGKIDFRMVSRFWRPDQTLVLELSPRASEEDVRTSKARIEELLPSG